MKSSCAGLSRVSTSLSQAPDSVARQAKHGVHADPTHPYRHTGADGRHRSRPARENKDRDGGLLSAQFHSSEYNGLSEDTGQVLSYRPERFHASFEASSRDAPQSLPRRKPGMTNLLNAISDSRHGASRQSRARLEPRTALDATEFLPSLEAQPVIFRQRWVSPRSTHPTCWAKPPEPYLLMKTLASEGADCPPGTRL